MKTLDWIYNNIKIEKRYNREVVTIVVNDVEMISFGEEGNISKNESNADNFIELLKKSWSLFWVKLP